ncbi:hypothetical protein NC653_031167 [Populus alba x Populus x berolinensis]|uniref:Secreted protein n=1 Tax=Populus alba x Populus x berolinensis TaxID=444605 RepID=A0AAD6LXP0_9ROSI|nr:hypothetical protein NC653_031167 [Populus alba x Populus x berolinensis]
MMHRVLILVMLSFVSTGGKIRAKLVAEPRGADGRGGDSWRGRESRSSSWHAGVIIASDELELPFEGILDHRKVCSLLLFSSCFVSFKFRGHGYFFLSFLFFPVRPDHKLLSFSLMLRLSFGFVEETFGL